MTAFSTLRHGGFSIGTYSSFNANCYCGDNPDNVIKNRKLLCDYLDIPQDRLIIPHQVHQTKVVKVDVSFLSSSPEAQQQTLDGVDALITNEQGCCICVSTADCIPVIIYDPKHKASAIVHAGWRGCVQGAISKGIQAMQEAYSTQPKNLHALIGPHISAERYPVGAEVLDEFIRAGFDVKPLITPHPSPSGPRWNLDLRTFCLHELQRAGIHPDSIVNNLQCTYNLSDLYFSARRQGIACGRNYTGIILER